MPATTRKNTPRLRDGVMKRGTTWSYVIRVKDPETGVSKPRWVGGFATEQDAKAARDEARVRARVALEDLTESLAWRYVVRSNRGLNRDERAAVDRALVLLTDEPQLGAPDGPTEPVGASTHPSASAAPSQEGPPRLRLLK